LRKNRGEGDLSGWACYPRRMRIALLVLLLAPLASAQAVLPPEAKPFHSLQGRGVQIYTCTAGAWTFTAPEADLYDGDTKVGTHSAGPVWTWQDGSSIRGKVLTTTPAPEHTNIPWLLLSASPNGDTAGELTGTKFVRRTDTSGGVAPTTGCDATHTGATVRVPYTALYSFYR
jgi:hypothetical protein